MKTRVSNLTNFLLSLTLCFGFVSCNNEDFYKKDELQNPFQDPNTTGSVDNGDQGGTNGSTTGTSTSGVDGSTTSGATTGSTVGGVDGSTTSGATTGSTVGGVDGSTTSGATTGSTVGGVDGSTTSGSTTGSTVGGVDGSTTSGSTTGGTTGSGVVDCGPNVTSNRDANCVEESFNQAAAQTKKLDILWVIDNSGSMADEQALLGTNFNAFINDFITKDVDFKMAITTTDASSPTKKGAMVPDSDVLLTSAQARIDESAFKANFNRLVRVGTVGSGYEKGLEGTEGFMTKYGASFLRAEAYLAVVILSDEEDQSANAVNYYTNLLKSNKSSDGLVKVYSIVDVTRSNIGSQGVSTGYQRYADASNNTAGTVLDIRNDFYNSLASMGDSIINLLDSFALANTIVTASLKVYVNGVESTDYTFDSASRSIKFDNAHIPVVGAEIKVYYLKQ